MTDRPSGNPSSKTTDLRQLRTRRALRDGLLSLLKTQPFDEITIRDITSESLVGYNTFFRHYSSKEELVEEIVAEEFLQLLERSQPALIRAETHQSALALCEYVNDNRDLWSALLCGGAAPVLKRMLIGYALSNGDNTPTLDWLPADLGATVGIGAALDILTWWLSKHSECTIEQVSNLMDRLVITPMLAQESTWKQKQAKP